MMTSSTPYPKYLHIQQTLRSQILKGYYAPGARFPTEGVLARQFNVSRGTVVRAIHTLEQEGLLYRQQGRGTFVSLPEYRALSFRLSAAPPATSTDGIQVKLLDKDAIFPPPDVARRLHVSFHQSVIKLVHLQLQDGVPVAHEIRYLPQALCPQLLQEDTENQSVHTLLVGKYGIPLLKAVYSIEAIAFGEKEARLLSTTKGTLGFLVERLTYTSDQQPAVLFRQIRVGRRYTFNAEVITDI